ncbi:MAG: hypothetical protein E2O54_05370 [Gammaproteobacteria bacterium]|nr:MAG: hypothetical protein E2O58_01665 [Gammaproteobacteria bacterium]TDJ41374.1 MAG: hypothetical protein E2O54_05370 [Gammaproteobacteria bacterium]
MTPRRGYIGTVGLCAGLMLVTGFATAQDDVPYRALFFGEIDYRQSDGDGDDGFIIGQAVAQLTGNIDERLSVMTEMTATARQNEDFEFEVERLVIKYDFSDQFKLSAGRYHTPIGYWNTAFHHGSWLQTTIARPETVKFGSNVIPIHFVGILLEGKIRESDFGYRVGFGNGRAEQINDPGDLGDDNDEPAYVGSFYYRPLDKYRLEAGVSVYVDTATPEVGPEVDEVIFSGYVALQGETPEVIVEYDYADHQRTDTAGPDGSTSSIYGQIAYRLSGGAANFKPYLRAEHLDVEDDDPLLSPLVDSYDGVTVGIRWDFSPYASLKAEVRNEEFDNADDETSFWLQLAFVFDPRRPLGRSITQTGARSMMR